MLTLIFDETLSGHHLEYLHHYYVGAIQRPDEKYVICIPSSFGEVKDKYEWPEAKNVKFEFIAAEDEASLRKPGIYKHGWIASRVLNRYVRDLKPDRVLLTTLMLFVPFIVFMLPSWVRVKGIMYKIYLYREKSMPFLRLLTEKFRFWCLSKSRLIERVFVLNDHDSAETFNKLYHTDKFQFLPDPVPSVDRSKVHDIRKELNIPQDKKVFLHFGGLSDRKGTLDILDAIGLCSKEDLADKTFIFAGHQSKNLEPLFSARYNFVKDKAQILVFNEFCSYDFLYNLCYTCDVILMPYHLTDLSSGVLGYASVFNKPVVGPSDGLIGRLIRQYNFGLALDEISAKSLELAFCCPIVCDSKNYVAKNDVHAFISSILV